MVDEFVTALRDHEAFCRRVFSSFRRLSLPPGVSLCLLASRSSTALTQARLARVLALIVLFVGVATVVEFSADVNFRFDSFAIWKAASFFGLAARSNSMAFQKKRLLAGLLTTCSKPNFPPPSHSSRKLSIVTDLGKVNFVTALMTAAPYSSPASGFSTTMPP
jgi:hypothetical protein